MRSVARFAMPAVLLSALLGCSSDPADPLPEDDASLEDAGDEASVDDVPPVDDVPAVDDAPTPPDDVPVVGEDVASAIDAPVATDIPGDRAAMDAPVTVDRPGDVPVAADRPGDVAGDGSAPTITIPYDFTGIVGTGQSLSVGAAGAPVINTTQPYRNLKLNDTGSEPRWDGMGDRLALVPLVEPIRPRLTGYPATVYPNNIAGETPHSAMANQLTAMTMGRSNREMVTVHTAVGESGRSITSIERNGTGRAFAATLYEARAINTLVRAMGRRYGVGAVILTHGESDATRATYAADVYRLFTDYNRELRAITGQQAAIPMLVSQQSSVPATAGARPVSAQAQWRLGVDHPGQVVCVGPRYQYNYAADRIHFDAYGYQRLGIKYAQVYYERVLLGRPWRPLQPRAVRRAGRVITVDFDVPVGPLAWDTSITAPHQTAFTEWSRGRGFEVQNAAGRLRIDNAVINGSSVDITLSAVPAAAGLVVRYAMTQDADGLMSGPLTGRRGQLRDSDPFVGVDRQAIRCNVTQGMTRVTAATANGFSRRGIRDLVTAAGTPGLTGETAVIAMPNASTVMLSRPWEGATGAATLTFRSDQRNYCVQFEMAVP